MLYIHGMHYKKISNYHYFALLLALTHCVDPSIPPSLPVVPAIRAPRSEASFLLARHCRKATVCGVYVGSTQDHTHQQHLQPFLASRS